MIYLSGSLASALGLPDKKIAVTRWDISALKVSYDDKKSVYIAEGNVIIKGGDTELKADYLEFNNITTDARARGNVTLTTGQDTVTCDSLQLNLQSETGTVFNGALFMQENNFHIKGDKIEKIEGDTYKIGAGTITSCSGDSPDWKISARDIKVTIEGYGFAKHATLWAKKVPAIYVPYLIFPVKRKRQTGLIAPGYSSSGRKGFEYEQPLFIAIAKNQDATIYLDFMEKRGLKTAVEYRYILDTDSRGGIFIDYLHDREIDDGTKKTADFSFSSTPRRTNSNRYWIRSKFDQQLPLDSSLKLDLDIVSDADFLHEFKNGFTGFQETSNYFADTFGRSIDGYDDTTRENRLNLNKIWQNKTLNLDLQWFDNVTARRQKSDDYTLQTLPGISYGSSKQKIKSLFLYYDLDSNFKYFYRKDTNLSLINGERLDLHPTFSLPFRFGKYLNIEPALGLRETVWYTDNFRAASKTSLEDGFNHREIFDFHFNIASKVEKVFDISSKFADKVKHEIFPELKYTFIPNVDQNDLPFFNAVDRINRENSITWVLTQRFTARNHSQNNKNYYHEFAWLKLYQTYDINKKRDHMDEPFSDITLQGEISFNKYLYFDTRLNYSPYAHNLSSNETGITLADSRGDSFHAEYRFKRDISKSAFGIIRITIFDWLNAYYSHEQDIFNNTRIESKLGLEFKRSCWSFVTSYTDTPDDKSVSILIKLYGIGAFGTK